jgi:hypothetical protein
MSDKEDLKPKLLRKNKESHFILTKETINQEEVTIANIHVPNVSVLIFLK